MHYQRWRNAQVDFKPPWFGLPELCGMDDCTRPRLARGLCDTHYRRLRTHGDPTINGRAKIPGYETAHSRVYRRKGSASRYVCHGCGEVPAAHWAYDNNDPDALTTNRRGSLMRYSLDPIHYLPMCVRCHKAFDRRMAKLEAAVISLTDRVERLEAMIADDGR